MMHVIDKGTNEMISEVPGFAKTRDLDLLVEQTRTKCTKMQDSALHESLLYVKSV